MIRSANALFRTSATYSAPKKGVEGKIIRGAKVIQLGDVNDHRPMKVDEETLATVVDQINGPSKGLKARWTHPNLCSDGMGKHLGYWRDARVEGDAVIADLHVSDAAFSSPIGDIGSYVLQLAQEDPDAFGVSVAGRFTEEYEAQLDEVEPGERLPIRFASLRSADVVADPAATRGGLFSIDDFGAPAWAEAFIESQFSEMEPDEVFGRVVEFLSRYYKKDFSIMTTQQVAPAQEPEASLSIKREDAQPYIEAFGDAGARAYLEGLSLLECYQAQYEAVKTANEELNAKVADLEARIEAFDSQSGENEPLDATPDAQLSEDQKRRAAKIEEYKQKGVSDAAARWAVSFSKS